VLRQRTHSPHTGPSTLACSVLDRPAQTPCRAVSCCKQAQKQPHTRVFHTNHTPRQKSCSAGCAHAADFTTLNVDPASALCCAHPKTTLLQVCSFRHSTCHAGCSLENAVLYAGYVCHSQPSVVLLLQEVQPGVVASTQVVQRPYASRKAPKLLTPGRIVAQVRWTVRSV
jgi:hypothetical protein